jgi:hypothetical protein
MLLMLLLLLLLQSPLDNLTRLLLGLIVFTDQRADITTGNGITTPTTTTSYCCAIAILLVLVLVLTLLLLLLLLLFAPLPLLLLRLLFLGQMALRPRVSPLPALLLRDLLVLRTMLQRVPGKKSGETNERDRRNTGNISPGKNRNGQKKNKKKPEKAYYQ